MTKKNIWKGAQEQQDSISTLDAKHKFLKSSKSLHYKWLKWTKLRQLFVQNMCSHSYLNNFIVTSGIPSSTYIIRFGIGVILFPNEIRWEHRRISQYEWLKIFFGISNHSQYSKQIIYTNKHIGAYSLKKSA